MFKSQILRFVFRTLATFASLMGIACAVNLPDYANVTGLRILAMVADTPEVSDNAAVVTITPYISDINGSGRGLLYSYQTCVDPGVAQGVKPSCGATWSTPVSFGPVGTARQTYTGAATPLSVSLPSGVLAASQQPTVPNQFNGVAYLVVYQVTSQDLTASVKGFKRILVSTNPTKNQNPSLTSVLQGSTALSVVPGISVLPQGTVNLSVTLSANSIENYQYQNSDGSIGNRTETLIVTWFYSDGSIQYDRTTSSSTNQWTVPASPPSKRASVIAVVVRDGRGGEDIQQVEFQ